MNSAKMKVLVINSSPNSKRGLCDSLEDNNHEVHVARSNEEGLDQAAILMPELVILDVTASDLQASEVCRQLRSWSTAAIIVLSNDDKDEHKIKVLDSGADDFLTKPFGMGELLARMRAIYRRCLNTKQESSSFECGDLHINFAHRLVTRAGSEVHLTPKEYKLLRCLTLNANRIVTHRQLLTEVWGTKLNHDKSAARPNKHYSHIVRVHIANLRNKLEENPEKPVFIQTEARVGYRFRTKT